MPATQERPEPADHARVRWADEGVREDAREQLGLDGGRTRPHSPLLFLLRDCQTERGESLEDVRDDYEDVQFRPAHDAVALDVGVDHVMRERRGGRGQRRVVTGLLGDDEQARQPPVHDHRVVVGRCLYREQDVARMG